ncbi:hypothetical protein AB0E77_08685 [Streptomyces sp. NPDC032940]|uniref:hypothetical protein n=1 Tax=Streptomyces sp. NPDC032940 TaxID=3155366 RepID=UPI0033C5AC7E
MREAERGDGGEGVPASGDVVAAALLESADGEPEACREQGVLHRVHGAANAPVRPAARHAVRGCAGR